MLPGSWSVCTNANEIRKTCGALAHICLTVQNYSRQTGSGPWVWGERERERAPGKLPWLCLQQKAIVWCGRTAGSKAPAPTGYALGKMPDGGHCWMTSTSPYSEQSPPKAPEDLEKHIKQLQFDAFLFIVYYRRNVWVISVNFRCSKTIIVVNYTVFLKRQDWWHFK